MDPKRRRTLVAAVIAGVVFAGASYAIGQQIKQSTEEAASGAPPAATITSEAVLVPARGPSLPGLPRQPKTKPTTDGTTGEDDDRYAARRPHRRRPRPTGTTGATGTTGPPARPPTGTTTDDTPTTGTTDEPPPDHYPPTTHRRVIHPPTSPTTSPAATTRRPRRAEPLPVSRRVLAHVALNGACARHRPGGVRQRRRDAPIAKVPQAGARTPPASSRTGGSSPRTRASTASASSWSVERPDGTREVWTPAHGGRRCSAAIATTAGASGWSGRAPIGSPHGCCPRPRATSSRRRARGGHARCA